MNKKFIFSIGWFRVGDGAFGKVDKDPDGILRLSRCVVISGVACSGTMHTSPVVLDFRLHTNVYNLLEVDGKQLNSSVPTLSQAPQCCTSIEDFKTKFCTLCILVICVGEIVMRSSLSIFQPRIER